MLPGYVLTEVCRLVLTDADCYRSRDDLHADMLTRIRYLLACEESIGELVSYAGYDPEGYWPGYIDTFLGEVEELKAKLDTQEGGRS